VKKIWADSGYNGEKLQTYATKYGKELEIVKRAPGRVRIYNEDMIAEWIEVERGFEVQPRRWVVERTFAWIGRFRRMSKDYEYLIKTAESMLCLSATKLMISRCLLII
jgi:transposase